MNRNISNAECASTRVNTNSNVNDLQLANYMYVKREDLQLGAVERPMARFMSPKYKSVSTGLPDFVCPNTASDVSKMSAGFRYIRQRSRSLSTVCPSRTEENCEDFCKDEYFKWPRTREIRKRINKRRLFIPERLSKSSMHDRRLAKAAKKSKISKLLQSSKCDKLASVRRSVKHASKRKRAVPKSSLHSISWSKAIKRQKMSQSLISMKSAQKPKSPKVNARQKRYKLVSKSSFKKTKVIMKNKASKQKRKAKSTKSATSVNKLKKTKKHSIDPKGDEKPTPEEFDWKPKSEIRRYRYKTGQKVPKDFKRASYEMAKPVKIINKRNETASKKSASKKKL